ncbi:MAG: PEGA domain-containing protein [Proteobacteria bacterium]|nr:PEGA domain-containing protein [Pseudomonadota bacterium]
MAIRPLLPLLISTLLMLPAAAGAVTVSVVGVHGNGNQDREALVQMSDDMVAGFKTAGLEVVHGEELRNRLFGSRETLVENVFLEPVRSAFDEGRILYEKAQPDGAVQALARAEQALDGVEHFVRDPRLSVDVQLYLGLAHLSLGNEDDARQAFSEVVRMDPNRVLDTLEYPPKIVELFESVRAEVVRLAGATLQIHSGHTTGARVYLDGRLVGTSPVTVDRLPPGKHTVLVDGGSEGRWFGSFTLRSGEVEEVAAELKTPSLGLGEGESMQEPRSSLSKRLYRELAVAAGTDLVAVAAFDEAGDFTLAIYSGRSSTFSVSAAASLAAAPGARSAFIRQLVERVARYSDDSGAIKEERVSAEAIPLLMGGNVQLNEYLFGAEDWRVADASATRPVDPEPAPVRRAPPKAAAVAVAIIAGVLGAAGAGIGIGVGVSQANAVDPGGVLVITVP